MTDQAKIYLKLGAEFAPHDSVNHQKDQYARVEGDVRSPPTPSKAISAYSSAVCSAPTSIAPRSISIAISRSSISATTTARAWYE